jgi:hypothetical protein
MKLLLYSHCSAPGIGLCNRQGPSSRHSAGKTPRRSARILGQQARQRATEFCDRQRMLNARENVYAQLRFH